MENQNGFSTTCSKCGRTIYEGEMLNIRGRYVCESCADSYIFSRTADTGRPKRRVPSAFFHFMFSLLPGAGHMYLGLMKKGLFQMCLFYLCIYLSAALDGMFALAIPIIWTYSFFDSLSLRRRVVNGEAVSDDISGVTAFLNRNRGIVFLVVLVLIGCAAFSSLVNVSADGVRSVVEITNGSAAHATEIVTEYAVPPMYHHRNLVDFIKPLALIAIGSVIVLKVCRKKKTDVVSAGGYDND